MNINIDGKAAEEFKKILGLPPYLIFTFIGAILVIVSIVYNNNFYSVWILFLYSVIGSIWRYIEKDVDHGIQQIIEKEKNKGISHLVVIIIYHIGNLGLLYGLLYYLKLV